MKTLCAALLLLSLLVPGRAAAQTSDDTHAQAIFAQRIDAYDQLHARLAGPLPAFDTLSTRELNVYRAFLRSAIRAARPHARQGDLLGAPVDLLVKRLVGGALDGWSVETLLADLADEHPSLAIGRQVIINNPYPMDASHEVPPMLLRTLPTLPDSLMYRVVGDTLVLWDADADLVVDYLPHAFDLATED